MQRSKIFNEIYEKGTWNDKSKTIPLSGPGSSLENTAKYREMLDKIVKELEINSIVDLGCGDLTWIPHTNAFKTCAYTGIDIVKTLIDSHCEKFKDKTFLCLDINADTLPNGDLCIIRDVLFHLSFSEVFNVLSNIKGKFKYYLITSSNNLVNNNDFNSYHYHALNVRIEPFNLKKYQVLLEEPKFNRDVLLFDYQFLSQ